MFVKVKAFFLLISFDFIFTVINRTGPGSVIVAKTYLQMELFYRNISFCMS